MKPILSIVGIVGGIICLAVAAFVPLAGAKDNELETTTVQLFNAETVATSGQVTSAVVHIGKAAGIFRLQYAITGSGTLKIELFESIDGTNYIEAPEMSDVATGLTVGSSLVTFSPGLAPYVKFEVTETGGAASAVITLWLAVQ